MAQSDTIGAVNAGLDIEVPWSIHFAQLPSVVGNGITIDQINDSVSRVLEQKFRFGIAYASNTSDSKAGPWGLSTATTLLNTGAYSDSLTKIQNHLALAEETEIKSAVLLSNGTGGTPVLPIKTNGSVTNIAVIGLDVPISVSTETNLQPGVRRHPAFRDGYQHR